MRKLRPLVLTDKHIAPIEREIQRVLYLLIYDRLARILQKKKVPNVLEVQNAINALIAALRAGTVWYDGKRYRGQFNAAIVRELRAIGATFDAKSKSWAIALPDIPGDAKIAQSESDARIEAARREMITALDSIDVDAVDKISTSTAEYHHAINWMESDFEQASSAIAIAPKLTPAMKQMIAQEYGTNLDKYIKNWSEEAILDLREKVSAHALSGGRAEQLEKMLQESYGQSKAKARFLARQETSLLMSQFQEQRYKDIGVTKYQWSGANDERERPDHRALNGKIFSFDDPPITNRKTGARNNPGEDFGCRCVAIPIVE